MEQPKLLKDLGMLFPKPQSKRKVRYGEYTCPVCNNVFTAMSTSVNTGHTKSCGCLIKQCKEDLFIINRKDFTQSILSQELHYNPITGVFKRLAGKDITGKTNSAGYHAIMVAGHSYLAHRLAWLYVYGVFPKMIDHIDGNKINNAITNLREVSSQENQQNLTIASNNTSGVTGVSFSKSHCKWESKVQVGGKTIHLGRYSDKADAVLARKQGEIKYGFHNNHGKSKQIQISNTVASASYEKCHAQ